MTIPSPDASELEFMKQCVPDGTLDSFIEKITKYGEILYEVNQTMNLTAIPPEEFWTKHVCDSLSIARVFPEFRSGEIPRSALLLDLGCGAGLPSIVLASAFPFLHITAMDSRGKKAKFVGDTAAALGLNLLRAEHARAGETMAKYKSAFTFITARAVGAAPALWKEAFGLLNRNGKMIIYRTTTQTEGELPEFKKMKPGPGVQCTDPFELPNGAGERMFLILSK